jgi:hypothetical protein
LRQRQTEFTVITLARVSMILPLQNGHVAGRGTSSVNRESYIDLVPPFLAAANPNVSAG